MSNDNTVEMIGYYGSDKIIAQSAWTSTSRELTEEKIGRIPALLTMLADAGHHTPFEKSTLHFLITTDIATHVHVIKHRVACSVNAESARYKELKEDKFFLPQDFIGIKANTHALTIDDKEADWYDLLERYTQIGNQLYHDCLRDIEPTLGRKRAKESARYFKGYNSQMTADVAFNFRSFVYFLKLRNKPEAQKEVREVAAQMLELVKNIEGNPFEHTIKAFHL